MLAGSLIEEIVNEIKSFKLNLIEVKVDDIIYAECYDEMIGEDKTINAFYSRDMDLVNFDNKIYRTPYWWYNSLDTEDLIYKLKINCLNNKRKDLDAYGSMSVEHNGHKYCFINTYDFEYKDDSIIKIDGENEYYKNRSTVVDVCTIRDDGLVEIYSLGIDAETKGFVSLLDSYAYLPNKLSSNKDFFNLMGGKRGARWHWNDNTLCVSLRCNKDAYRYVSDDFKQETVGLSLSTRLVLNLNNRLCIFNKEKL